jgi:hypothetical protein
VKAPSERSATNAARFSEASRGLSRGPSGPIDRTPQPSRNIEYTRSSETFPKQGFGGWHEDRAFSAFPLLGAGFTFTCPLTGTVLDLYPELAEIEDVTGAETAATDDTEFVRVR